jgi:transposase/IS5 family transposase
MSRFLPYNPEQAYLLPPNVKDELGADHLCFFIRDVVRRLDLSSFEQAYSEEGGALYAPELMLNVWLYGYALGITSARRMERRLVEDLAFRYLAGGARVDNWTLSQFRRRHGRGINDAFTQVLEWARRIGWGTLGRVVIDSTRVKASASRDRVDTEQKLRNERAKLRRQVRRWQKACDRDDTEPGGLQVAIEEAERKLAEMPRRLERLHKSGMQRLSRTDEDARFLRQRGQGFELGYTAEIAVSDDHLIVGQRVTQNATDNHSLLPMVEAVEQQSGAPPAQVVADSGFFSVANLQELARRGIDGYVPDSNLARELNTGHRAAGIGRNRIRSPQLHRMRQKLRSRAGRAVYRRRKAVVEPVLGVLKQQRGMRQFRTRTLMKVGIEFTLAALAYNLTRLHQRRRS